MLAPAHRLAPLLWQHAPVSRGTGLPGAFRPPTPVAGTMLQAAGVEDVLPVEQEDGAPLARQAGGAATEDGA